MLKQFFQKTDQVTLGLRISIIAHILALGISAISYSLSCNKQSNVQFQFSPEANQKTKSSEAKAKMPSQEAIDQQFIDKLMTN